MAVIETKKAVAIGIGVVLSLVILFVAFGLLQNVFTRASDVKPQDVVISEITQNSAHVAWTTGVETEAVVEYGTSPTTLTAFAPEAIKTTNHAVDLTLLSADTGYYFDIKVGDQKFDNGGVPWTFTTKSQGVQAVPTAVPTLPAATSTPSAAVTPSSSCNETNCEAMKQKFGKGCTTQDYFRCVKKLTPTP